MKTKFKIKLLIIFLILLSTNIKAETILFDSKNIKIEQEGNMIFATKGIAKIPSKNLSHSLSLHIQNSNKIAYFR